MATTGAERQKKYRKRLGGKGERRIDMHVSTETIAALQRLAKQNDLSQRQMLEKLINEADRQTFASLGENREEQAEWI